MVCRQWVTRLICFENRSIELVYPFDYVNAIFRVCIREGEGGDDDPTIYVYPLTRNWTIYINVVRLASQSVSLVRSSLCRHLVLTHRVGWMVGWRNLFVGKLINAINLEANSWAVTDDDRFNEMSFSRSFFPRLSSPPPAYSWWCYGGSAFELTGWMDDWMNDWLAERVGWTYVTPSSYWD